MEAGRGEMISVCACFSTRKLFCRKWEASQDVPSKHWVDQNLSGPAGAIPGDFVLGFLLSQDIFALPNR